MQRSGLGQDVPVRLRRQRRSAVQRLPEYVQQTAQALQRNWYVQRRSGVEHRHAAAETCGAMQSYRSNMSLIQVLMDLKSVSLVIQAGR